MHKQHTGTLAHMHARVRTHGHTHTRTHARTRAHTERAAFLFELGAAARSKQSGRQTYGVVRVGGGEKDTSR